MKFESEMVNIVGEEFFNTHENIIELSVPVVGPENDKARQVLTRLKRRGEGRIDRNIKAGSEDRGRL